jgi:hypothetical protein
MDEFVAIGGSGCLGLFEQSSPLLHVAQGSQILVKLIQGAAIGFALARNLAHGKAVRRRASTPLRI